MRAREEDALRWYTMLMRSAFKLSVTRDLRASPPP
jgi:hypothetical protein